MGSLIFVFATAMPRRARIKLELDPFFSLVSDGCPPSALWRAGFYYQRLFYGRQFATQRARSPTFQYF